MNTKVKCPSCSAAIDPAINTVCPNCGFQVCLGLAPTIIQPVRRLQKISASVLVSLLIDITGSTGRFARGVPLAVKHILELIGAKARETKVYVHTGGDLDYGQQCVLLCNGLPVPEAVVEVARLGFGGGGDEPETHADSVETVLATTPWEPDARKWRNALIVFLTADSKAARSGTTPAKLGAALKSRGILVYLVAEDYPFARELAAAADGLFFAISNDPDPVQMQQIAAGISQSLLITAAGGATRPMTVVAPSP